MGRMKEMSKGKTEMTDNEKKDRAFEKLLEVCTELGWWVAVPTSEDLDGVILGTREFVNTDCMNAAFLIFEPASENSTTDLGDVDINKADTSIIN